jgi:hypothetical protein
MMVVKAVNPCLSHHVGGNHDNQGDLSTVTSGTFQSTLEDAEIGATNPFEGET